MKNTQLMYLCLGWLAITQTIELSAQKTDVWKGGFPGQETNWACARNWSLNTVPDGNCNVVIPMLMQREKNYPVLSTADQEVYSLVIEPQASLTITEAGTLSILGLSPYDKPLWNAGFLNLFGKLLLPNETPDSLAKR